MDKKQSKLTRLRERAAVILETTKPLSPFTIDTDALAEELRIHQIELELQLEDLQRSYAALESAQQRYTRLFDNAPIAYFVIDTNARIVNCNIAASQMLGLAPEGLKGKLFAEYIVPDFQDSFYFCWRALRNERIAKDCEIELQRKNGTRVPVLMKTNLPAEDSKEVLLAVTDLSSVKQIDETVARNSELGKEVSEVRLSVLSVISPEFLKPLATILSSVEILYKHGRRLTDRKKEQVYMSIRNLVWYLSDTLQDARNVQELDRYQSFRLESFDVLTFTQQIMNDIEVIADGRSIILDISTKNESVMVFWNMNLYRRVLMNLIGTLLSFSSRTVRCTLEVHETSLKLQIYTPTTSLKKDELAEMFDALYEGRNTKFIQGRGNGLYLVYMSVQSLGGTIRHKFHNDGGLSFEIELHRLQTSPSSYRQ